ncbi:MAG TPA: hypothetical protein VLA03_00715, partial [Draconibacterium sp.]|nr:hypothetical protein [Draconibacterium sp.]
TTALIVEPLKIQSIYLEEGWNLYSSYLIPYNSNMADILKNLQIQNQLIEVQDEDRKTFLESNTGWNNISIASTNLVLLFD